MIKLKDNIDKWVKKNKGNVVFIGTFLEFKDNKVSDSVVIGYGDREIINLLTKEHSKMLKADKEEFINW